MGFNTASVWIKVALFCLVLSVILFVIGFATISWMSNDGSDYHGYRWSDDWGLWRRTTCEYRRGCFSEKLNTRVLTFYGLEGNDDSIFLNLEWNEMEWIGRESPPLLSLIGDGTLTGKNCSL